MKRSFGFVAAIAVFGSLTTAAMAQVEIPSQITIQGTGLVTKSSTADGRTSDATKSGGLLVGYSYQFSRWFGAEGNYGYTRNTQKFTQVETQSSIESDFHEVTGALVAHIPVNARRFRPYALAGGGALVFDPTDRYFVNGAERQTRGAFLYGGGANFDITDNFGVRAEYRGLVYKVPDFGVSSFNLDKFTHLAQPSVGFFFRF
jgi:opacity protein-like surface antigen